jgi:hypothetical protein
MSNHIRAWVEVINNAYDEEHGVLGRLREGQFDRAGAQRLLSVLGELELGEGPIDRRLVSLLWYMPLFIEWQTSRVPDSDRQDVSNLAAEVISILERVLGVP